MDQAVTSETIKLRARKRAAGIIAAIALLLGVSWVVNRSVSASVGIGELRVSEVRMGAIDNTINAAGVVVPVREEQLSSPNQSRVSKVIAKAGQTVTAGQLLMVLDDHTIRLAIDNLSEQIAQQALRVQVLNAEMGSALKKITSDAELLELDLQNNKVKLARSQKLGAIGIASAADLQAAELAVKRNEVQLRQHREALVDARVTTQGNVEAARLQKSIFQKQLESQQRLLDQTQVKAPFAGLLTWLLADEGASVSTGQLIAKVSVLGNFKVEATVSDFYARYVSVGQKANVEYSGQTLPAEVQTIFPEIQNGTMKLLLTLTQPDHPALRHKLRVEANIITEQKERTLVFEAGPAINGKGRQNLFMLEGGQAVKRSVEIGLSDSRKIEVLSGATVGDKIVISDVSRFSHLDRFRVSQ